MASTGPRSSLVLLVLPMLLLTGCAGGADGAPEGPPSSPAPEVGLDLAGTWSDTAVAVSNTCGLSQPAPGSSNVTDGIVIEQDARAITLTAPVNVQGTQTIATGSLADDGSMILVGTDSGTTITLTFQATGSSEITGTSQVDTGECVFHFTNEMVKTAEAEA